MSGPYARRWLELRPCRNSASGSCPRCHRHKDRDAAHTVAQVADLGPGCGDGPARTVADRDRPGHLPSAIHEALGSEVPTRTPTACCATTSQKGTDITAGTQSANSTRLPRASTADAVRHSDGRRQQRLWLNYYFRLRKAAMQRLLVNPSRSPATNGSTFWRTPIAA